MKPRYLYDLGESSRRRGKVVTHFRAAWLYIHEPRLLAGQQAVVSLPEYFDGIPMISMRHIQARIQAAKHIRCLLLPAGKMRLKCMWQEIV